MKPFHIAIVALSFLVTVSGCSAAVEDSDAEAEQGTAEDDLTKEPSLTFGTWKSPTCETVGDGTYQLRTYRIAANGVFADWNRFAAPSCTPSSRLFTIRMGGSSKVDGLSRVLRHTADIRVFIDEKGIVPTSRAGLDRLDRECPSSEWKMDEERAVTNTGCGTLVPPRAECPVEYDLMRLDRGRLYFGDRSVPLCTEATRPKKLSAWGVAFARAL